MEDSLRVRLGMLQEATVAVPGDCPPPRISATLIFQTTPWLELSVSINDKFVFIHIPKTAGTSFRDLLGNIFGAARVRYTETKSHNDIRSQANTGQGAQHPP